MQNNKILLQEELAACKIQLDTARKELGNKGERLAFFEKQYSQRQKQLHGELEYVTIVLNSFSEPFFILDADNNVQLLNNAALDYCNKSYEKIIGQSCHVVCLPESKQCNECPIEKAVYLGKKVSYERKGAKNFNLTELIRAYPMLDENHKQQGMLVRIKDITEKRKINDQLVLADRLASLNRLSAGFAHEIRNPLAGITLFVDIMADTERFDRTEQELEILAEIKESCHKMGNIVTRILDFAKPITFARRAIAINRLVKSALQLYSSKINKANILLELDLAEDLPDVKGEPVELEQVLNNLFINSIDAMPDGGTLSITTSVHESSFHTGRTVVKASIGDTGTGIATEYNDKIFSPFFSTKPAGTGLGLTIAHQITSRHGGLLYLNSDKENGAEFVFELPLMNK